MITIRNIQLPNKKRVDIIIKGSKIQSIQEPSISIISKNEIDGAGLVALPGIIDPHVHFRVPGGSHKEDWETGRAAALKGGVIMVFDMPNTSPPLTSIIRLKEKRKLVGFNPKVEARFWFGATPDNFDEIVAANREPDVIGIKVYMGATTGDLLVTKKKDIYKIFSICAANNLIVGVHAEDETLMQAKRAALDREPRIVDHCRIRDTDVEVSAVRQALYFAEQTRCRLYLCHLSTPESVELAVHAKEKGLPVFIEASPHHITFDETKLQGADGAYFKMNPPLRTSEQVERLCQYVCNGSVDVIGSDHAPHTYEEKQNDRYDDVPSGVPGVETLLPILLNLVNKGKLTIERLTNLTSINATKIFGLKPNKIEAGYDADLVLVDLNQETAFRNSEVATKCGWTPYNGMKVRGAVNQVIVKGAIV